MQRLGHDAVDACAVEAVEPALGCNAVGGRRRHVQRWADPSEHPLEQLPPRRERLLAHVVVIQREQIEDDVCRRRLTREPLHARFRRVKPAHQRFELEAFTPRRHDLPVEHDPSLVERQHGGDELREVAGERPSVAAA